MRDVAHPMFAIVAVATLSAAGSAARADWRDPIAGATAILPEHFEPGETALTVHIAPRRQATPSDDRAPTRWNLPLVDRRLGAGERTAPLDTRLLEAIDRIEPIYDPTRLDGPNVAVPMHISAGSAEARDLFGDRWRLASADTNVDADVRPLATIWIAAGKPRPCSGYRVRRRHEWGEPSLSAPNLADCRAIEARQARGFADSSPLPVAVAVPPIPVFAAPEPGSRMTSEEFWAAQRARIAGIHAHLSRRWADRGRRAATASAAP